MGSGCKVKHDRHHLKTAEATISESRHLPHVLDGGGGWMHLDRWVVPRRSVCHERLCAPLRKFTNDISQHESNSCCIEILLCPLGLKSTRPDGAGSRPEHLTTACHGYGLSSSRLMTAVRQHTTSRHKSISMLQRLGSLLGL
jgi:hypothetical protein